MATLALTAAGSAIGGALLPAPILGLTGAAIGSALGGLAGGVIDQRLFGQSRDRGGSARLADRLYINASAEGQPVPRVFGRMRVSGHVFWSARFRATAVTETTASGGGKGGGGGETTTTGYKYSLTFAVALCDGPIDGIGRIWVDGKPMPAADTQIRLHKGTADQAPDPGIAAIEGAENTPAYRGTAYLVFQDLALEPFGNRLPQITVEVLRAPRPPLALEDGPALSDLARGVALSPGSGEFSLATSHVWRQEDEASFTTENRNTASGETDLPTALDQLATALPLADTALLIISWFGDDLRLGACTIRPCVETAGKLTEPLEWRVSGLDRAGARVVSEDARGRPVYGGTPADAAVLEAIAELKARGLRVICYPFVLMDIPAGNALPDPYGGAEQAAFPWRGRIAPMADKTAQVAADVAAFFGTASAGDFTTGAGGVAYGGPDEWSFRRFILHNAALCAAAGGVDGFCIGSEMRGLTTARAASGVYPAVGALRALLAEVRALLPVASLGYAADWSEYFGHQPQDGSNDVCFHLDPLWADGNCDFIGIDNYLPLSDWRDTPGHLDSGYGTIHNLAYLQANVEGGEYYDYHYASPAARDAQARSPITDGAHGEPWVFRPKDLRGWWSNPHHDRPGGVRAASPTAWVPQSKPIWFTECGFPAADKGTNQPNVFYDPKSSESALPHYSTGARDDLIQLRGLQALLGYWSAPGNNPVSAVYGGAMIDMSAACIWTWDTRPYPDYPLRTDVWSDGGNHALGHWITGRVSGGSLAAVVAEICAWNGVTDADVSRLEGMVQGYVVDASSSARDALAPLMIAHDFDAVEEGGAIRFVPRDAVPAVTLTPDDLAVEDALDAPPEPFALTRVEEASLPAALRLAYIDRDGDYQAASVQVGAAAARRERIEAIDLPLALSSGEAQGIAERWLEAVRLSRETAQFALPPSRLDLGPGDVVALDTGGRVYPYRIERVDDSGLRRIEAARIAPYALPAPAIADRGASLPAVAPPLPVLAEIADLPLGPGSAPQLAAIAAPWPGSVDLWRLDADATPRHAARAAAPATLGTLLDPLPPAAPGRWSRDVSARVRLVEGALLSRAPLDVLNGANLAALRHPGGVWELFQFRDAVLVEPGVWRLSGFLRGQGGTEHLVTGALGAGARFLLVDGALAPIGGADALLGLTRTYHAGPGGSDPAGPVQRVLGFAHPGAAQRPYTPARLRYAGETLHWTPRAAGDRDSWTTAPDPPSLWSVRIHAGGTVYRWVETGAASYAYTAADRAFDGTPTPFTASVAAVTGAYGRGPERSIIIHG